MALKGYKVFITHKGKLEKQIYSSDQEYCEMFIRAFPLPARNLMIQQDRSLVVVSPEERDLGNVK